MPVRCLTFSGDRRVLANYHQTAAIKVLITVGPLLRQADADLPEQRRSSGAKDKAHPGSERLGRYK